MKRGDLLLRYCGLFLVITVLMCVKEPSRIGIMFTAVSYPDVLKHDGYYTILPFGDTISISGYTPSEYVVMLEYEDTLFLSCWKDTASDDTMQLDIYVDGEPEIEKGYMFWPDVIFEYRYPSSSVE